MIIAAEGYEWQLLSVEKGCFLLRSRLTNRFMFLSGKCRGLRTARKLRNHRREQKWHDKQYKKAHLGTALKANPFGGASHAKGIVLEKV